MRAVFIRGDSSFWFGKEMAKINHRKGKIMRSQKRRGIKMIAHEQCAKFVNPNKSPFSGEAALVNFDIEEPFVPALGRLAMAFVFSDVGNKFIVKADLARLAGVEGTIRIELGSR
jgi:hypothetical protein